MSDQRFSTLLGRLENQEYIAPRPRHQKDKTTNTVRLTAKGVELLDGIKAERRKIVEDLFRGLEAKQKDYLAERLEAVNFTHKEKQRCEYSC